MLVQYFALSIHTKTGIKYMLMTLSYASPHSHFSLSFYPLTTWCRSCICKLSQFIPHVISSPSPTFSDFCLTHLLQVLFWRFAQRRHLTLWEFLSPALFFWHGVLNGCSESWAVVPSTTVRNRLCGPGRRRKVEMRYTTVPRSPFFCLLLNYIAQSRRDPLESIKKQEVIANSNLCRCLWIRSWSCITHLWYLEA